MLVFAASRISTVSQISGRLTRTDRKRENGSITVIAGLSGWRVRLMSTRALKVRTLFLRSALRVTGLSRALGLWRLLVFMTLLVPLACLQCLVLNCRRIGCGGRIRLDGRMLHFQQVRPLFFGHRLLRY